MLRVYTVEKPDVSVKSSPQFRDVAVFVWEAGCKERVDFMLSLDAARTLAKNLNDACDHAESAKVVEMGGARRL